MLRSCVPVCWSSVVYVTTQSWRNGLVAVQRHWTPDRFTTEEEERIREFKPRIPLNIEDDLPEYFYLDDTPATMESVPASVSTQDLNDLVYHWAVRGNIELSCSLVDLMEQRGMRPAEQSVVALLGCAGLVGDKRASALRTKYAHLLDKKEVRK